MLNEGISRHFLTHVNKYLQVFEFCCGIFCKDRSVNNISAVFSKIEHLLLIISSYWS